MVLRIVDVASHVADFLDMIGEDGGLVIGEADDTAVVDALEVGTGDGEVNRADFDVAGIFCFGEGVFEAGAGLGEVGDFAFADACGFGDADTENFDGAIGFDFTDDDAGFAGAYFKADVNFASASHDGVSCG